MKVLLYGADEQGCGYYRMMEPGRVARAEGIDASFETRIAAEVGQVPGGRMIHRLREDVEADVVVLQRPAKTQVVEYIPEFQRKGIAVCVEIDDDLSRLPPKHPSLEAFNGKVARDEHWRNVAMACQVADMVICTTDALAERFGQHGRVRVLPNCVPESLLSVPRSSTGKTIGWSGAVHFHPDDLEITYGGVQLALEGSDWDFLKIGGGAEIVQRGLNLTDLPEMTGPLPLPEYHQALGRLDIGIVPLAPSAFNEAKSYLKGLEYAAAGVPFVASPTAEYKWLSEEGLGLLAKDRGRNWKSALRKLMDCDDLAGVGKMMREVVRSEHTYEVQGWRWIEAWKDAIKNRQKATERSVAA